MPEHFAVPLRKREFKTTTGRPGIGLPAEDPLEKVDGEYVCRTCRRPVVRVNKAVWNHKDPKDARAGRTAAG